VSNLVKNIRISLLAATLLSALAVLPGCGKEEHKKAATQVVAKVNGDEISVHQVNFVLSRAQGITPENAEKAKKEVLDKLIDQQLAIQQAEATKLDRDPGVMQTIESARRDILARAYLEKVVAAQPKPSTDEARKYYLEHPEMFAERRVYNLQEILVPAANIAEVQQLVAQNKSMQEIANALKSHDIKFAANAGVRPADQLPPQVATKLHAAKDGQTVFIEAPQGAMVAHIAGSQVQPVPESEALPRIQQYLAGQRNNEAVANELKALRAKAKIEQTGEIALAPASAPAKAPEATGVDAASVAKGVAGLK
jgi:EpsD family peptidyl-prolyl cis-trans isomerase